MSKVFHVRVRKVECNIGIGFVVDEFFQTVDQRHFHSKMFPEKFGLSLSLGCHSSMATVNSLRSLSHTVYLSINGITSTETRNLVAKIYQVLARYLYVSKCFIFLNGTDDTTTHAYRNRIVLGVF